MSGQGALDFRDWRFETCEERLALSAQPVADFWYDTTLAEASVASSADQSSGAADLQVLRNAYGLTGAGQTVAIIDSGIAYDHVALGGGLGSGYKVVGGWDFAENDANPYDDGPAGFHGTHVAGIVSADDGRYPGAAPGVDLVALRVFNDQGGGYFSWVEQALSWVHEHRDSFQSPITTVNLSLGTEWNATSLPKWATLEEELRQLADDGLFVTVAAGNSFQTYNTAGLSYPAASPYVTAVASVDASGQLSRFSQRTSGVLAAPGERIMSTVPDAFYGSDGVKNDWGAASGTSMAAPHLAGVGVLLREAMQNLGQTQITGAGIQQLLKSTADSGVDSVTGSTYYRVNAARAIQTLVGADDYGGTAAAAANLGSVPASRLISGTIGSLTDRDFFQFTATRTGTATLTLDDPHRAAAWIAASGAVPQGQRLTFSVTAGQTYVVGLGASGQSIGKYSVQLDVTGPQRVISPVSWGTIDQKQFASVGISGEAWYEVGTSRSGRLSVEALFDAAGGPISIELCDQQQRPLSASSTVTGGSRADAEVTKGQTVLVHVVGVNANVGFRVTNLIGMSSGVMSVSGTAGADTLQLNASSGVLSVNGVTYALAGVSQVNMNGGLGSDRLRIEGSAAAETVVLGPGSGRVSGGAVTIEAAGFESIEFAAGQGDRATLLDSAGDELFEATPLWARMSGNGFANVVSAAQAVVGVSQAGGADAVRVFDSAGDDRVAASPGGLSIEGAGFRVEARGFSQMLVLATAGGYDSALLQDSWGADQLDASSRFAWLRGAGYSLRLEGFESIVVKATPGTHDVVRFWGGAGNETLTVWASQRNFYSGGVTLQTSNFQYAHFDGGGGYDQVDYATASRGGWLYGRANYGSIVDRAFETQFAEIEAVTARVLGAHKLKANLAGLEFYFHRLGRK